MVVRRFCDACGERIPAGERHHYFEMAECEDAYRVQSGEVFEMEICAECGEKVRTALGLRKGAIRKRKVVE